MRISWRFVVWRTVWSSARKSKDAMVQREVDALQRMRASVIDVQPPDLENEVRLRTARLSHARLPVRAHEPRDSHGLTATNAAVLSGQALSTTSMLPSEPPTWKIKCPSRCV
jgi:hypothetical protein